MYSTSALPREKEWAPSVLHQAYNIDNVHHAPAELICRSTPPVTRDGEIASQTASSNVQRIGYTMESYRQPACGSAH